MGLPASARIPIAFSECIPADTIFAQMLGNKPRDRFVAHPRILEDLKYEARRRGLWNLFLPRSHYAEGSGYSNLEYALMAEQLGKSQIASEAMNCSAPDSGNVEVLAKFGNAPQKKEWLEPLLEGKIRSAFLMTEPDIASSDATNIQFEIKRDGDSYVLNGSKWWSSGTGDPRCELYIVMGKTDPSNPNSHRQQSVLLVPARSAGITVHRMLSVFGYDDAPHGHGHISFNNVRIPATNLVLGEGRGFEIIQGRLGPGRIHHTMRCIGAVRDRQACVSSMQERC
ncbi:related to acyl-CoA dehydrogenases [Fusarium mangiferae]|uniref:Related to acyl-CoA dehydrogenases n=1 Tax=Fusarium mangiferae TaxID=192010 RepID=A0A1L7U7N2_FUSMA|nr:related to acyl-CoA dehydrogenases [Fusarium mangiferae]CVL06379.1 related to acyl-CoA dehydrogenases [Fusarium mangiferae]